MHIYLNKSMISTFAEGEFWSKKSKVPLGMDEGVLVFTVSDFKFHKEWKSTFNKSGTKERT